jgi:hypothetical protein
VTGALTIAAIVGFICWQIGIDQTRERVNHQWWAEDPKRFAGKFKRLP